jgi:hypothetical protein
LTIPAVLLSWRKHAILALSMNRSLKQLEAFFGPKALPSPKPVVFEDSSRGIALMVSPEPEAQRGHRNAQASRHLFSIQIK